MQRRDFIRLSSTGLAGLCLGDMWHMAEAALRRDSGYSIVILGDTHYDVHPDTVYHSDYNEQDARLNKIQRAEFARNGEMWLERCPRLVQRASRLVTSDTRMVLQMGDLVQGDCGNPEVHKRMLTDAMDMLKPYFPGLPLVTVVGNHDIRGTGAKRAYHELMPPLMGRELGQEVTKTTFGYSIGDDAYLVLDFNHPDDAETEKLLAKYRGARYTFVVVHGPMFPLDSANCRWFYHGRAKDTEVRRHFRREFARRDAICLCGHVHRTEFADWLGDGGRITQITMNSVWAKEELASYEIISQGAEQYGTLRAEARIGAGGKPYVDETPLFDEYRDGLVAYSVSRAAGSYKLHVGRKHVYMDFYGGDSRRAATRFIIR